MKIAIFGATGGTGRQLLEQALEEGHSVTACVRDASKLEDVTSSNLKIIQGDVLNENTVEEVVAGQDVVLSALGAGAKRTTLREDGTREIVKAMEKKGIKRLITLSSLGVGDSRKNLDFFTKFIVVDLFLRHPFADHERQEKVVRESDLDWTIVRPPHLVKGSRTGEYQHGFATDYRNIKAKISRGDVADFMLNQISNDTYVRKSPGVSY